MMNISKISRMAIAVIFALILITSAAFSQQDGNNTLAIRGTLPWHNYLAGPTAWNLKDYEEYLDSLKNSGLNFVAFHCYTGGVDRYATYVEPLIRIEYKNILPNAEFDTSLTSRWGYRPLKVKDFAFGTSKLFELPAGSEAFGSDCALLAKDNEDRYKSAQELMKKAIETAHKKGIQVGIAFEFGIYPPELASVVPTKSRIAGALIPDPTVPCSIEILQVTIDDILRTYPDIDWIWLWLHEFSHKVNWCNAKPGEDFKKLYEKNVHYFTDSNDSHNLYTGVWSFEYIRQAYDYIKQKAPNVKIAIGGWGGENQLPPIMRGLDKALPKDIVFSCLIPHEGWDSKSQLLADIAKNRSVWAIPWLEEDRCLWHYQPRVAAIRKEVKLAGEHGLNGVVGLHTTDKNIRLNLKAFSRFVCNPQDSTSVEDIYREYYEIMSGKSAAKRLAPALAEMDEQNQLSQFKSPEYLPYDPTWGQIKLELKNHLIDLITKIEKEIRSTTCVSCQEELEWLANNFRFAILLDQVSRSIEPAYNLKQAWLKKQIEPNSLDAKIDAARKSLEEVPIEKLFQTYADRTRSRGELGILSSLNQKLWLEYKELDKFLSTLENANSQISNSPQ